MLGQGCLGRMRYEYTEKMIYNQLLYFATLFDVEKAKSMAKGTDRGKLRSITEPASTNCLQKEYKP